MSDTNVDPQPEDERPAATSSPLEVDIQPVPTDGNQVDPAPADEGYEVAPREEGRPDPEPAEGTEVEVVPDDGNQEASE